MKEQTHPADLLSYGKLDKDQWFCRAL